MPNSETLQTTSAIAPIYTTIGADGEPRFPGEPDLQRIGEVLVCRAQEIAARVVDPAGGACTLDPETVCSFERLARTWTVAVGGWMGGGGERSARESGLECLRIFGQLANTRLAPVDQLLRLCLRWRDATGHAATVSAMRLHLSPDALLTAHAMLQRSLDVTTVRLCECFESERRHTDAELRFLATHDAVTGLPNRTLIAERVSALLERARRDRLTVALLFIDLDNFKVVNDTLGHPAGDELLRTVTARLRRVVPANGSLARFGGDEFVVVLEDVAGTDDAEQAARGVLDAFTDPFVLLRGSACLRVSASVGVALTDSAGLDDLLRDADIAMYRAKREGKARYSVITSRG